ncbi:MAG: hypothetical protein H8E55_21245 [Pelagibacterales bacterium]|nr:hypothetical protein [Pelagibacterales bacterium]
MKKKFEYLRVVQENGKYRLYDPYGVEQKDIYVRDIMCEKALLNGQCIRYNIESGTSMRKPIEMFNDRQLKEVEVKTSNNIEADPILNFIHNESVDLRPKTLVMPDLKWKYLVRSAMRSKNIMMTGAAGCGKTMAAKKLVEALDRPHYNLKKIITHDELLLMQKDLRIKIKSVKKLES